MDETMTFCQDVPVIGTYDVVVAGGGTAGSLAGVTAARRGLRTLIVEQFGSLGGSATMAQVTPLMSSGISGNRGHSPLSEEVANRMRQLGGTESDDYWFDPVLLAFVLEDMAVGAGCSLLYHTLVTDVRRDGDAISAVLVCSKDGLGWIRARYFIDASGDADLALRAGVPCSSGDQRGINQPVSLRFEMGGIDYDVFHTWQRQQGNKANKYFAMNTPGMGALLGQAEAEGLLQHQDVVYLQGFGIPGKPDAMSFNCPELTTQAGVADADFLSRKQIEGKQAILRLRRFLRERVPGFAGAYITSVAPMVGLRESRRIQSVYIMTIQDLLGYRKFDDAITSSAYPIDVHGVDDVTLGLRYDLSVSPDERYWQVPFRCMVPIGVSNLLVAGRCAGFDFRAQSAARIQLICRAMGEAAGQAAAMAAARGCSFQALDPVAVRQELVSRGLRL